MYSINSDSNIKNIINFDEQYKWFNSYVDSFLNTEDDNLYKENIELKRCHCFNVAHHMSKISESLNLTTKESSLARLIGLFHDIGRFPQYSKYRTFSDENSVYHGDLGIKVLKDTGKINDFSIETSKIIIHSIHNHGLAAIEEGLDKKTLLFAKLIRDADKMDIFRIVDAYYKKMLTGKRNISIELGLKIEDHVSANVLDSFMQEKIILKNDLKTLNDFKILQAAWIFDLNFDYTRGYVKESGFLNSIIKSITLADVQQKVYKKAKKYLA